LGPEKYIFPLFLLNFFLLVTYPSEQAKMVPGIDTITKKLIILYNRIFCVQRNDLYRSLNEP